MFSLVVDDFAIQYVGKDHTNHLLNLLHKDCKAVSVDWKVALYCGITCRWGYKAYTRNMSMPGYVQATLAKFQHDTPRRPQHSPQRQNRIQYGVKVQLMDAPNLSNLLSINDI
jgi:hypothetical protein